MFSPRFSAMDLTAAYRYNQNMMEYYTCKLGVWTLFIIVIACPFASVFLANVVILIGLVPIFYVSCL